MDSSKATTTFEVTDVEMSEEDFSERLLASWTREGWIDREEDIAVYMTSAMAIAKLASKFEVVQILEMRDEGIVVRSEAAQ